MAQRASVYSFLYRNLEIKRDRRQRPLLGERFMGLFSFFDRIRAASPWGGRHRRGRLAIVSTPRCGNTWLRRMLNHSYRFSAQENGELHPYNPLEAPWSALPDRCILMTHWDRVEPFTSLLKEHGFFVVTLARHPLDVLLSVLQYAPSGGSLRWLEGFNGDERPIYHVTPQSDEFRRYAVGPRARALLSVSAQWWRAPGCHRLRYEDLVADPLKSLSGLARAMGEEPLVPFEESIEAHRIERLRTAETARHFWQGKPGLWRTLLSADEAQRIADAHRDVFATLGYSCTPDPSISTAVASHNWSQVATSRAA